jgi:hypothetical protein
MWQILCEATHRRRDSGARGNCSALQFWTIRASDGQSPSPVFRRRRDAAAGSGASLCGSQFHRSGSSHKNLKIDPFCFGVAGKLGAKFAGPLIIAGKCRLKQAKESNCPRTQNDLVRLSRLISNILQKTSPRASL